MQTWTFEFVVDVVDDTTDDVVGVLRRYSFAGKVKRN
jgi:hypothetical protein